MKDNKLSPADRRPVATAGSHGLEEEIDLLRQGVRRLFELAQGQDDSEAVKTLNILSAAAARLARLVQTQAQLHGQESDLDALMMQALAEALKEMGL